jgi:hypothetical protein
MSKNNTSYENGVTGVLLVAFVILKLCKLIGPGGGYFHLFGSQ